MVTSGDPDDRIDRHMPRSPPVEYSIIQRRHSCDGKKNEILERVQSPKFFQLLDVIKMFSIWLSVLDFVCSMKSLCVPSPQLNRYLW